MKTNGYDLQNFHLVSFPDVGNYVGFPLIQMKSVMKCLKSFMYSCKEKEGRKKGRKEKEGRKGGRKEGREEGRYLRIQGCYMGKSQIL